MERTTLNLKTSTSDFTTVLTRSEDKTQDLLTPEVCVICLDRISDRAIAQPCQHDHFHFSCLGTWLQHQQRCPLCKEQVRAVRYTDKDELSKLFHLPQDEARLPQRDVARLRYRGRDRSRQTWHGELAGHCRSSSTTKGEIETDPALLRRRHVYEHSLFSLHVGANRHSRYLPSGTVTPKLFASSPQHLGRARVFIRRELKVFDFLDPSVPFFANTGDHYEQQRPSRRATNREYLLEYIVAILQAIPLKGSEGQAEKLLGEYLGTDKARLFLHELETWLRSPFERLDEWDQVVQYREAE